MKKRIVLFSVLIMFVVVIGYGSRDSDKTADTDNETADIADEAAAMDNEKEDTSSEAESIVKETFAAWEQFQYHFFSDEYISDTEQNPYDSYVPVDADAYASIDEIVTELESVATEPIVTRYYDTYLSEDGMQYYKEESGLLYRSTATGILDGLHSTVNVVVQYEEDDAIYAFVIFPQEYAGGEHPEFEYVTLKEENGIWKIDMIQTGTLLDYLP